MDSLPESLTSIEDFLENAAFRTWVRERRPEDQLYWQQWLVLYPEKRDLYEQAVVTLLAIQATEQPVSDAQVRAKVMQLFNDPARPFTPERPIFSWHYGRWAVAAALLCLLFIWQLGQPTIHFFRQSRVPQEQLTDRGGWKIVKNISGQPMVVLLPDNSSVLLSTGSQLRFRKQMNQAFREVFLQGEGFFEVAKNPSRPFVVYTASLTARVVGTSFQVRAFTAEPSAQVRVKTGKVTVSSTQTPADTILLTVNEQLNLGPESQKLIKSKPSPTPADSSALISQPLTFNYAAVSGIFDQLESSYHMPIDYDRTLLSQCTFTGDLSDMPFLEKIRLICLTIDSSFELVDNQIIISSKGCKPM
ncbi:FecR family protein [Fibrella aquatica]|uniref:FecR family protein n=1 Tax=Fibrella aquatica TaxID=3242487 RepID=UPI00352029E5